MEKKLILVTSPPACGKTYVAKALAKNLKHVVYLDKDTLIVLSKQIFKVAGSRMYRSSAFFQQNIRDYEYDCVLALAMEALDYDDIVLINAPFTQEVRDNAFIADLKAKLAAKGATLAVIWVETSPEVVHQRMIERNSDRDTWKLAHWDEYLRRCNFAIPENLADPQHKDNLILFQNNNDDEFDASMKRCVAIFRGIPRGLTSLPGPRLLRVPGLFLCRPLPAHAAAARRPCTQPCRPGRRSDRHGQV